MVKRRLITGLVLVLFALVGFSLWWVSRKVLPYTASGTALGWGSVDSHPALHLQTVLDTAVSEYGVPGIQAAVRLADGNRWAGVSGTLDIERRRPLGREHILRVGSVTKVFTATLVFQLIEEGKLSLDDSLARWFPNVPNAKEISLRQLLNHHSGVLNILEVPSLVFRSIWPGTYWQPIELVKMIEGRQPHRAPGEGFSYSNTNYVLLGLIVEQVSGQKFETLLRQRIFNPLGLKNTYLVPYEALPDKLIYGFDRDLIPLPGLFSIAPRDQGWPTAAYASGALVSTSEDLLAFTDALFAGELISFESLQQITAFLPAKSPNTRTQTGQGLGVMQFDIEGQEWWGHTGEFIGFTAIAAHAPRANTTIALIGNLSVFEVEALLGELYRAALGDEE